MTKYPRTFHLPFSLGRGKDDKVLDTCEDFLNRAIVITEKLDGGNCTISGNGVFARSISETATHSSFDIVKNKTVSLQLYLDRENKKLICENMYARHSIKYNKLKSYYYTICLIDIEKERVCGWRSTAENENLPIIVPVLFEGSIQSERELEKLIQQLMSEGSKAGGRSIEGVVVRNYYGFQLSDFKNNVAKFVRKNHVQENSEHWTRRKMKVNYVV